MSLPVVGSARLGFGDDFSTHFAVGKPLIFVVLFGVVCALIVMCVQYFSRGRIDLGEATVAFLIFTTLPMFAVFAGIVSGILASFFLLRGAQREMTWEIDRERIRSRDAVGNEIVTPWSQAKRFRAGRGNFRVFLRPLGQRYIPRRAFDAGGQAEILRIAESHGLVR
jgi:hypothetical protein